MSATNNTIFNKHNVQSVPRKPIHISRKGKKLYKNCNTQFIPITKDEHIF